MFHIFTHILNCFNPLNPVNRWSFTIWLEINQVTEAATWETKTVSSTIPKVALTISGLWRCCFFLSVHSGLFHRDQSPVWLLSQNYLVQCFHRVEVCGATRLTNRPLFVISVFTPCVNHDNNTVENTRLIPVCWLCATISVWVTSPDGLIFMTLLLLMFSPGW